MYKIKSIAPSILVLLILLQSCVKESALVIEPIDSTVLMGKKKLTHKEMENSYFLTMKIGKETFSLFYNKDYNFESPSSLPLVNFSFYFGGSPSGNGDDEVNLNSILVNTTNDSNFPFQTYPSSENIWVGGIDLLTGEMSLQINNDLYKTTSESGILHIVNSSTAGLSEGSFEGQIVRVQNGIETILPISGSFKTYLWDL